MSDIHLSSRAVIEISGEESADFLQGLVTNDVLKIPIGNIRYAALLTPQGKYAFDLFIWRQENGFLIDVAASRAEAFMKTLTMYKLRRKLEMRFRYDLFVGATFDKNTKLQALVKAADPRHEALGTRFITEEPPKNDEKEYTNIRLGLGILEGTEIPLERAFILDYGFEKLNGVDFNKGCYVGQEVTARMHFKAIAKKRLYLIEASSNVEVGNKVFSNGVEIGEIMATTENIAVALLKCENADDQLFVNENQITVQKPQQVIL